MDLDFELIGVNDTIEVPVTVEVLEKGTTRNLNFKAEWQRDDVREARTLLQSIIDRESDSDDKLTGAALVDYQQDLIRSRLRYIRGFPTKKGKKIDAGEGCEYALDDVLEKMFASGAYTNGLMQSLLGSLAERNLAEAKRKN